MWTLPGRYLDYLGLVRLRLIKQLSRPCPNSVVGKFEADGGGRAIGAPQTVAKLLEPNQEFHFFDRFRPSRSSDGHHKANFFDSAGNKRNFGLVHTTSGMCRYQNRFFKRMNDQ